MSVQRASAQRNKCFVHTLHVTQMLDLQNTTPPPKPTMSRKRTRSRSEDNLYGNLRVQPLSQKNIALSDLIYCPATWAMADAIQAKQFVKAIHEPAPFSDDPICLKRLEECDYSKKITYDMAKKGRASRPIRVYADGAFDLFHQGHARVLLQAKNAFPNIYLIVGVCSDAMLHKRKGRTVLNEEERYDALRHCRYVDEILKDAPWTLSEKFLEEHKIDFIAHDDLPYPSGDCEDIYGPFKARGMFIATERTEGVSTSDIVARIVRDYDLYARRNLARGYSAKELNLSYLREKKFKFQNKMATLKDKSKSLFGSLGERKDDMINKWEEKSKEFIDNFLMMFGRNRHTLTRIISGSKKRILQAITPPGSPYHSSSESEDDFEPLTKIARKT